MRIRTRTTKTMTNDVLTFDNCIKNLALAEISLELFSVYSLELATKIVIDDVQILLIMPL